MTPHPRTLAAAAALGLLITGCSTDTDPDPDPDPAGPSTPTSSAPASASPTASPSPTSTLPLAKQKAVDQATAVILAYDQLMTDLLADPDPNLNDLNDLVTDPQLDIDLLNRRMLIGARETVIESTGPVTIASVDPVKIDLKGDPPTVTLLVCVDSSAVSGTYKDEPFTGSRQEMRYRVVKTTYLPDPGWAVARLMPPPGSEGSRPC